MIAKCLGRAPSAKDGWVWWLSSKVSYQAHKDGTRRKTRYVVTSSLEYHDECLVFASTGKGTITGELVGKLPPNYGAGRHLATLLGLGVSTLSVKKYKP